MTVVDCVKLFSISINNEGYQEYIQTKKVATGGNVKELHGKVM